MRVECAQYELEAAAMASPESKQVLEMLRNAPRPGPDTTLAQRRAGMEQFARPLEADCTATPVDAGGVPAEWVTAPGAGDAVVLYLHGGGYVIGSIVTHRDLAARISRASGTRVLLIDYRLAPEHPFPAAVEDAVTAYKWILDQGVPASKIAVAGDSAGGGLTVATLLALRDRGIDRPAAGACISPWVDLECTGESMTSRAALDPMVQREGVAEMASQYLGKTSARDPLASPIHANLAGLPPLMIQVGTSETLFDDAARLDARARCEGVEVHFEAWDEMVHVWHMFAGMCPESQEAIEHMGAFIKRAVS
jgi:acetyl esterase/lipase